MASSMLEMLRPSSFVARGDRDVSTSSRSTPAAARARVGDVEHELFEPLAADARGRRVHGEIQHIGLHQISIGRIDRSAGNRDARFFAVPKFGPCAPPPIA